MQLGKFIAIVIILLALLVAFFIPIYYQIKDEQKIRNFKIFKQKPLTTEDLNGY